MEHLEVLALLREIAEQDQELVDRGLELGRLESAGFWTRLRWVFTGVGK